MQKPKILIVSATKKEAKEFLNYRIKEESDDLYLLKYKSLQLDLLITGVGIFAMTFKFLKHLQSHTYDFIILVGISGAYSRNLQLGDVVQVETERFGDLGLLNGDSFSDIFEMSLNNENSFPFENKTLINYSLINNDTLLQLKSVKGNTVQTIRSKIINGIRSNTDVESMEGAAFFYICLSERIPFVQIRGISNMFHNLLSCSPT
jgi:futalosine hydrolase